MGISGEVASLSSRFLSLMERTAPHLRGKVLAPEGRV